MYKKSPQGWLKHWDFILLDIFCLQLAFVVAYLVRQGLENPYSDQVYRTVAFVFMLCQIVVMFLGQSYQDILKRGYYIEFTKTAKHVLMVMLLSVLYLFATQQAVSYSRLTLFYTAFLYLCFDYVGRVWHKKYVLKKNATKKKEQPWGTGQAVLAAKDVLTTPFIVINADDYYGKEGFRAVHEYLVNGGQSCMAGFVLKNTLSDNGGVTRGICKMDAENNLTEVVETKNIVKTAEGAEADEVKLDVDSLVFMNMWGLTPDFLKTLEEGFKEFFEKEVPVNPLKAEYLIPTFIGELLSEGKMSVKVLRTNDTWYGMTYKEDVAAVKESFSKMLEDGTYKGDLFSDL